MVSESVTADRPGPLFPRWAYVLGKWCNRVLSCIGGVLLALLVTIPRGLGAGWAFVLGAAFAVTLSTALFLLTWLVTLLAIAVGWLCATVLLGALVVVERVSRRWPAR